jgi:hypothetical protein
MARLAPAFILLALAGCDTAMRGSVDQLDAYKNPATSIERVAGLTGEAIACDDVDPVCFQLHASRARACAGLSATDDRLRECAVKEWHLAQARLGAEASDAERVAALAGEAAAVKGLRDRSDAAGAAERQADMRALVAKLAAIPGGAGEAAYFAADVDVFAVLVGATPPSEACARLDGAARALTGLAAPPDLAARAAALRLAVSSARTSGGRSCP